MRHRPPPSTAPVTLDGAPITDVAGNVVHDAGGQRRGRQHDPGPRADPHGAARGRRLADAGLDGCARRGRDRPLHRALARSNGAAAWRCRSVASLSQADLSAPDHATLTYRVTAYDRAGNASVASNAATVLDGLDGGQRAAQPARRTTPTAGSPTLNWTAPGRRSACSTTTSTATGCCLDGTTGRADDLHGHLRHGGRARLRRARARSQPRRALGLLQGHRRPHGARPAAAPRRRSSCRVTTCSSTGRSRATRSPASRATSCAARAAGARRRPPTAARRSARPTAAACTDTTVTSGTWSYGVFARDGAGNVGLIGTVPGVVILDRTAPLAPTKLKLTQAKAKKSKVPSTSITYTLRWAQADGRRPRSHRRRPQPLARSGEAERRALDLPRSGHLDQDQAEGGADGLPGAVRLRPRRQLLAQAGAQGDQSRVAHPAAAADRAASCARPRRCSPGRPRRARRTTTCSSTSTASGRSWPGRPTRTTRFRRARSRPGTYVWYVWPAIVQKNKLARVRQAHRPRHFTYKK